MQEAPHVGPSVVHYFCFRFIPLQLYMSSSTNPEDLDSNHTYPVSLLLRL
jgi:hypothetical protein